MPAAGASPKCWAYVGGHVVARKKAGQVTLFDKGVKTRAMVLFPDTWRVVAAHRMKETDPEGRGLTGNPAAWRREPPRRMPGILGPRIHPQLV